MRNDNAPCYQCEERHTLCHSKCLRYAEWKEKKHVENNPDRWNYDIEELHRNRLKRRRKK